MWPLLASFQWSPPLIVLIVALVDVLQLRMLALIMRAYANLTAAQLASYLGMPEAQALVGG